MFVFRYSKYSRLKQTGDQAVSVFLLRLGDSTLHTYGITARLEQLRNTGELGFSVFGDLFLTPKKTKSEVQHLSSFYYSNIHHPHKFIQFSLLG